MSSPIGADRPPGEALRPWCVAALLLTSLTLNAMGLSYGMPNTNAWHGDDMCHYTLRTMADGFHGFPKYPLVHHLTLAAVYTPYLGWLWLTGAVDPSAGSLDSVFGDPRGSMTVLIVLSRIVSMLMATGTVWILYRILVRATGHWPAALIGAACYAFGSNMVLYAKMTSVDTPMMFWFAVTVLVYLRFLESLRPATGFLLGTLIGVSVCTKEQIGGAYVVLVATILVVYARRRREAITLGAARPTPLAIVFGATGILLTYAILSRFVFDPAGWFRRMSEWLGPGTDPEIWGGYPNTPEGYLRLLDTTVELLAYALGTPLVVLLAAGSVAALVWARPRAIYVAAPMVSYYLFTIVAVRYVYSRFLMPLQFLAGLLVGLAFALPALRRLRTGTAALALAVIVLSWSAHRCWRTNALLATNTRYGAEVFLAEHLPKRTTVEVYASDHWLPRLEYLGLGRDYQFGAMEESAFRVRRPAAVLVCSTRRWQLNEDQRRFVEWLRTESGYIEHVFHRDPPEALLAPETRQLIHPEIILLVRPE